MERLADYVIKRLVENNIEHIFLITGRGILHLTDAVAKNTGIKAVCTYHEQGASYAAMSYASANDSMSACMVSTGCAATNAITAALCAWQDNLPIIFISGQHMLNETTRFMKTSIRTYGSQEADIISMVETITKYAVMIEDASTIRMEMDKAIYYANEGRKGPVWIDIPLDIQNARIEVESLEGFEYPLTNQEVNKEDVEYVQKRIGEAKHPILFIGGGVRSAKAIKELEILIEKLKVPVVFSTSAADIFGSGNEFSIGAVGSLGGSRAGNFAVQNADFILVLGSKMCSQTTGIPEQFAREAKVCVVDIDPMEHKKKGIDIDRIINHDIKSFVSELVKYDIRNINSNWLEKCIHWKKNFDIKREKFIQDSLKNKKIDLYYFADVLSDKLPQDAVVITDAGLEELIIPSTMRYRQEQRCLFPAAQGAMGYAIPAIIGAYYAEKKNIITVVGDGSFMMNMQELLIIGTNRIPVKIFVINNNMYAVIRKRQKDLFRKRTIGNDPSDGVPAPNFEEIAKSFNIYYKKIKNSTELLRGLEEVLMMNEPCICEVYCIEEQPYFHTSFAITKSRKVVKRPLEDLSPFIEREVFLNEMIVEPIKE